MSIQNGQTERNHSILMQMRRELHLSGIIEVERFDESGAVFQTVCGEMTVEGSDIHIGVLDVDRGEVSLTGQIDGIFYAAAEVEKKEGFFKKLLR